MNSFYTILVTITSVFISLIILVIILVYYKRCKKDKKATNNKYYVTKAVRYQKGQEELDDLEQVTIDTNNEENLHQKKPFYFQFDDKAVFKPKGFPRLGNTCFMNAILQNLVWTPRIKDSLCGNNGNDVEAALFNLVNEAHIGYGGTVKKEFLMDVLNAARRHNDQFNGNEQQDSFEMFNTLVGAIQDDRLKCKPFENRANSNDTELKHIMKNCPLTRLFGGMFMTVYLYESCGHVDLKFQMFTSINVPVPKKRFWGKYGHSKGGNGSETNTDSDNDMFWPSKRAELKTLQEINRVNELTGIEHGLIELTGINEYEEKMLPCNECKDNIPGYCPSGKTIQKLLVLTPPPVLVLQINGFETEATGLRKINSKVSFSEVLNISPYCSAAYKVTEMSSNSTTLIYNLYGVVAHNGTLDGGHYIAYVKKAKRIPEKLFEEFLKNHDFKDPKIAYESKILDFLKNRSTLENSKNYANGQPGTSMKNHAQDNPDNESTWYCISDSHVMGSSVDAVLSIDNASILFYERGPSTTDEELYSETAV